MTTHQDTSTERDLVARLRDGVYGMNRIALCAEAADEIERLRAALASRDEAAHQHPDDEAVDRFSERMKWKLAQARAKGRSGWQDRAWPPEAISQALREHVEKGDPTDVANYCMFLAARNEPIYPAAQQPQVQSLQEMEARKDAAYLERNQVVAALAKCFPSGIARTAIEGWPEDWHGCVYIDLPTGQASWHFHDSQAYLFADLPPYQGKWDGHTTEEKYARLAALKQQGQAVSNEQIDACFDGLMPSGCGKSRYDIARAILALRPDHFPDAGKMMQLSDDFATIAGLESAVGHLSTLVDEQRALLVESEDVFGRDGHGGKYEDGECELIDRIRSHLDMTAPPPNGITAKEQGNGN